MSGCPRDLAVLEHWSSSLQRSRARRDRAGRGRSKSPSKAENASVLALIDPVRALERDLANEEAWELSLGRSRARRRAAELQFVPGGSRAKRVSLGALAALTVGPTASIAAGQGTGTANPEPATTSEHVIVLSEGAEGRQVQLLQQALAITVDGMFGPETEEAVEGVPGQQRPDRRRHRRTADERGAARRLIGQFLDRVHLERQPGRLHRRSIQRDAGAGESGEGSVQRLQSALKLPVDGNFGPETEAAVRRLQARHGMTVDGIVGPETWGALGIHGQETLTPPPSALPRHESHHHAASAATSEGGGEVSGNAVERLQKALKISVDGEFGPATESAVKRLQARHGLTPDGVVGPATWSVLGISTEGTLTPSASVKDASSEGSSSSAGGGSSVVARIISAGDEIATRPYVWGGGHGSFISEGYDCSGSVSYALHGAGLLSSPEDSSALESYGEAGSG